MAGAAARVLIVEDTPTQAEVALALLRDMGHETRLATTGEDAIPLAAEWRPDAILMDLELPGISGLDAMRRIRAEGVQAAVVVVTAQGGIGSAVEAIREGAVDYLPKPYPKARLSTTLANALEKRALASELQEARSRLSRDRFMGFIGASAPMQAVYRTIESVAASRASVFITGESGTGKELAAEAIHRASPRRARAFVALNCGAIPRDLLESEVFGHVRGAFTGATDTRMGAARLADGGTLFLDEIGEMPLDMQVKLLRFLQTGSFQPVGSSKAERVDVRVVSATNRDPWAEVEAGRFREDLYYRLYVVPLAMPPLRERGSDVVLIARHLLATFAAEEGRRFRGFAPEAEAALAACPWPGNVRQLQNVVRTIVVLHDAERVVAAMLPPTLLRAGGGQPPAVPQPVPAPLPASLSDEPAPLPAAPPEAFPGVFPGLADFVPLAELERRYILAALDHVAQDVPRAAAILGINASTIYRRLQAWRAEPG